MNREIINLIKPKITMRKLFNIFALIASVMFVVGCEPDNPTPEPTPSEKPQITLTAGEITAESFTFGKRL